jgi:ABC-type phosphate transport system substrate-binding protein
VATVLVGTLGVVVPQPASAARRPFIQGSGSASAANILSQWTVDLTAPGSTIWVWFTGNGSSQGRQDFANRSTDYGITDLPYEGGTDVSERPYSYVPLVAEGVGFAYNLQVGGERVRDLRLSGETLVRIFTGDIVSWADPAIAADNDGRVLPPTRITPIVRSDGNGATRALTDYFTTQFRSLWSPCNGGSVAATVYFPVHCGAPTGSDVAESGEDAVIDRIKDPSADGAIGYVAPSSAWRYDLSVAAVENAAGYFVYPAGYSVSIGINNVKDPRAYPLSHYQSAIVPTSATDPRMTTAKRQALVDFLSHAVCAGQPVVLPHGFGPLRRNVVVHALSQIAHVAAGDGGVDLTGLDPNACDTPDIDEVTPQPKACQRRGAGPCGPPTNTQAPSIAGPVRVGATVQASMGSWRNADTLSLRWLADGAPVDGATGAAYRVPAALLGRTLSLEVTGLGDDFLQPTRTVRSGGVRVAPGRLSGSALAIAGRPIVGRTLAVRGARIAGAQIRVQWYAAGRKIRGATSLRWTLRWAQVGKRVSVRVEASATAYQTFVRRSLRTAKVVRRR